MGKEEKVVLLMCLVLFIAVCLSGFNFIKMYGYEEVCLAQYCTEWAEGEEWIKDNCHLNNNKYEYCDVQIEGQSYKVALENINLTQVRSCRESTCISTVRVKQTGGQK